MSRFTIKPEIQSLSPRNPLHVLALGFGSGLSPVMPGTVGTIAAIPFYLLLSHLSLTSYLLAIVIGFLVGIYACDVTTKALGKDDHGAIVWDEFIGFFITMIAAPTGWLWILLGFVLFRLFDIMKPQPIRWLDKYVKGGLGIMIDDVLAGIAAAAVLQLIAYLVI